MAGRKRGYVHLAATRDKIQAALLVKRLQDHVHADTPLLDASQVNAAKALLNKVLPDVSSITLTGDPEAPVRHAVEIRIIDSDDTA